MKLTTEFIESELEYAKSIVNDCISDFEEPIINEIRISHSRSFWGNITNLGHNRFLLKVSDVFSELKDDEKSRNRFTSMLVHELLHTVRGCMNHGRKWKSLASIINHYYPELKIQRGTPMADFGIKKKTPTYNFQVICHNCGYSYMRQRKSETTNPYFLNTFCSCGNCGGRNEFEVKQLIGGKYVSVC